MRENYALELAEYGEASDGPVLFPRPSWGLGSDAKTGTLKPSHHVPKNLLAQRKPRFSGTWWKLKRTRRGMKGEKRKLLWTRLRGVSNCDKLLNLDNFPLTIV